MITKKFISREKASRAGRLPGLINARRRNKICTKKMSYLHRADSSSVQPCASKPSNASETQMLLPCTRACIGRRAHPGVCTACSRADAHGLVSPVTSLGNKDDTPSVKRLEPHVKTTAWRGAARQNPCAGGDRMHSPSRQRER